MSSSSRYDRDYMEILRDVIISIHNSRINKNYVHLIAKAKKKKTLSYLFLKGSDVYDFSYFLLLDTKYRIE